MKLQKILKSVTVKVISVVLFLALEIVAVSAAFWLMNQSDSLLLVVGIVLIITAVLAPVEIILRHLYNKIK